MLLKDYLISIKKEKIKNKKQNKKQKNKKQSCI